MDFNGLNPISEKCLFKEHLDQAEEALRNLVSNLSSPQNADILISNLPLILCSRNYLEVGLEAFLNKENSRESQLITYLSPKIGSSLDLRSRPEYHIEGIRKDIVDIDEWRSLHTNPTAVEQ